MGHLSLRWVVAALLLMTLGLTACTQDREDSLGGEPTAVGGGEIVLEETPGTSGTDVVTGTDTVTSTGVLTDSGAAIPTLEGGVPAEPTAVGEVPSTPGVGADPNATVDPNAQPTTVAVDGATPVPGSEGTDAGSSGGTTEATYTVQSGDTLFSIAVAQNTTVDALVSLNGLDANQPLTVGQVLRVPGTVAATGETAPAPTAVPSGGPRTHTVQPGEWIYQIARDYGVDPQAIINANPGIDPNNVQPGQVLTIP